MVFKSKWFILAVACLFLAAMSDLTRKYVLDKKMIKPNEMIIYVAIIIGLFGLCHYMYDNNCRPANKMNTKLFLILILIGIIGYSFTIAFTYAINLSPDVTLVGMIVSLNIILLYLVSSIFFEASPKFNMDIFFALILILIGINIISKKF